jgi:hypothetical protein
MYDLWMFMMMRETKHTWVRDGGKTVESGYMVWVSGGRLVWSEVGLSQPETNIGFLEE